MTDHDGLVDRPQILRVFHEIRAKEWETVWCDLTFAEPSLAGWLMAASADLQERLEIAGVASDVSVKLHKPLMEFFLTAVQSLRESQRRLWDDILEPGPQPPTEG